MLAAGSRPTSATGLTEPQIAILVERYKRELARYEKAAAMVGERLRRELREAGIKHMVSSRPKHPTDLAAKLRKKAKEKPDVYSWDLLHEDLGGVVTDLAGCRVVLYTDDDEAATGAMIQILLAQPNRPDAPAVRRRGVDKPYWATHALVYPYAPNESPDVSVDGAICELQVVTVAAHLFNEIEHDISYKERDEGLGADHVELQLLDEIRGVARVADRLVSELMTWRARRRKAANHTIRDAEDLRYVLSESAGWRVAGGGLGRLLRLLDQLMDSVTPGAVAELGTVTKLIESGRRRLGKHAQDFDEVSLYTVGLLDHFSEEIPAASRTWRGPRTAMRRAIELAIRLRAAQTEETIE